MSMSNVSSTYIYTPQSTLQKMSTEEDGSLIRSQAIQADEQNDNGSPPLSTCVRPIGDQVRENGSEEAQSASILWSRTEGPPPPSTNAAVAVEDQDDNDVVEPSHTRHSARTKPPPNVLNVSTLGQSAYYQSECINKLRATKAEMAEFGVHTCQMSKDAVLDYNYNTAKWEKFCNLTPSQHPYIAITRFYITDEGLRILGEGGIPQAQIHFALQPIL